jgi:hypothetical protein
MLLTNRDTLPDRGKFQNRRSFRTFPATDSLPSYCSKGISNINLIIIELDIGDSAGLTLLEP